MKAENSPAFEDHLNTARHRDTLLLVLAFVIPLLSFLFELAPERDGILLFGHRLPESCLLKKWADMDCAGCGLTRSFVLGIRADPEAFELHSLGPLLLLILILQIPYRSARILRRRRLIKEGLVVLESRRERWFWHIFRASLILALLIAWVIRLMNNEGLL